MGFELIPKNLQERYRFYERNYACGILTADFPDEWQDIVDCLQHFVLRKSFIENPGGGRSQIPITIDGFLRSRGWSEKRFDIKVVVDGTEYPTPTHKIDNVKNKVGLEVEWNNKTEFYDRDLNNFRLLHDLRVLAVGVIITRVTELQAEVFAPMGEKIANKYGPSTTHWDKLMPKVHGGGAGGCPLLIVGIKRECYDPNT